MAHFLCGELLALEVVEGLLVFAQIDLGADEHGLGVGAVMGDLGVPLGLNVVERSRVDHGEAKQEHVSLGVAEGTETRVLLLASRIPKSKVDQLAINLNACCEVIKDRRDVVDGEAVFCIADKQACFTDGAICECQFEMEEEKKESKG